MEGESVLNLEEAVETVECPVCGKNNPAGSSMYIHYPDGHKEIVCCTPCYARGAAWAAKKSLEESK